MMTKVQSKKLSQLKYLVLVPVLFGMLFYSSCSSNKNGIEKRIQTNYRIADGKLFSFKGDKETYLDSYFGEDPKGLLEEIPFEELPKKIREKHIDEIKNFRKLYKGKPELQKLIKYSRFFKTPDGRIAVATIGEGLKSIHPDKIGNELLFTRLEKTPNFPGCEERDSDCFMEKLEQHFYKNFDKTVLKNLESTTKRIKVNVDFNINTDGFVDDIIIKAPNEIIVNEARKAIASLPKMTPGQKYGKPIKANYKLPFTILIQ